MTSRERLKEVVDYFDETVASAEIKHREAAASIEKTLKMEEVTAIAGVRRSGKTYAMYDVAKKHGGVYINFEDERLVGFGLEDFEKLYSIAQERKTDILFLDEIQNVSGWEKFAVRTQKRMKLFVSGSNSSFLSSEFSSALTGRTVTFNVRPLSFKEFLFFKGTNNLKKEEKRAQIENYLDIGGFPRIVLTNEKNLIFEYFNRIIYRDVIPRFSIKNPTSIHALAVYLLSHIGSRFSYRNLKQHINVMHESTIKNYIFYLSQAFLIESITKFDPSLRAQEINPKKAYTVDPAFCSIGTSAAVNSTRVFENVVFNELRLRYPNYRIHYEHKKNEVDFLLVDGVKPKAAFNVCYEVANKEIFDREMAGLVQLRSGIKKYFITLYTCPFELPKDIQFVDAISFLLGEFTL